MNLNMEQLGTEDLDFIDMPDNRLTCHSLECTMHARDTKQNRPVGPERFMRKHSAL
jgi:hypothetical protein